ncbi:Complement C1q tumor necrosis factor- protein 6 [Bulinus truncatus]|nr:Complement C1q tumor necrosis factor- protein 6 [Bulinus truncatus]
MYKYFLIALILPVILQFTRAEAQLNKSVIFSVGLKSEKDLRAGEYLLYDHVYTNIGNAYDINTGVFTCPVKGVYLILLNSLTQKVNEAWLEVYRNNNYIMSVYGQHDPINISASNSVIVELNQGDRLYVKSRRSSGVYGKADDIYCTFSGYLITST